MRCPSCGTENPAGMKFCGNCAARLGNRCPRCGFDNPAQFKFCGECGASLQPDSPGAAAVAAAPVAAASPAVRVAPARPVEELPDGERKTVTALFADIKGSMDLLESLDPEEARAIVDPALKLMIDAVHRYDGYIVQSTGDGVFALFGAPVAHEDHAQRGLYAALRMTDAMRKYSAGLREAGNPPVEIRVGLNTGEVVVRTIRTGDEHTEYTPIGHSTSLAARMQTLAPTGSIVITEQTQKLTEGYFELKALGPARIRGVSEPVNVYEVVGIGPLRTRLQMSASRGLSKFVGRQAELDQLSRSWKAAVEGHGQIVAVMAEAGVGKSRLFHEFKLRSLKQAMVLEAFSVSHGKATPYLPIVDLLKGYFRIGDQDDERTRREKITGKVLALDRALEDTLPFLFVLMGISAADSSLSEMDPAPRRRRTREAVKSLLLRESLNQPLAAIFEDLHWVDEESEAVLKLLADSIGTARILMMVNFRPEYRHQWGSRTYYTQLRLDALGPENSVELLSGLLGDGPALAPLKATIMERTEGNPFFMEEMVQVLFDQGVLVRNGTVKIAKPLASIQVPATVNGILAARIDKLEPADKELLQTLAVIGKEFPIGLVRRVVGKTNDALAPMLANLQLSEFIYEQPAFPESEYTFKHALTQQVAYDSMLTERRRLIHERTAAALEELYADRLDDHLGELARHYSRSANADKAVQYLRRAAEQAHSRSAYDDAIKFAREALRLNATLPQSPERDRQELVLHMVIGPLIVATQGFTSPEMARNLERAQELCRRVGETPEVYPLLFGLWGFSFSTGHLSRARAAADQLTSLANRLGDDLLVSAADFATGSTMQWSGQFVEARKKLESAIEIFDRDIPRYLPMTQASVIPCRCQISWSLWILGYPDQSLARVNEALRLAAQLNRPFSTAFALTYAVSVAHLRGEYSNIRSRAEALIELARANGFGYWLAAGKMCLGRVEAGEGHFEKGLALLNEGVNELRTSGSDLLHTYSLGLLAEVYLMMRKPDECLKVVQRAIQQIDKMGHRISEPELHRLHGEAVLMQPDGTHEAERSFRLAIEIARRQSALSWELRAATSLARLKLKQGNHEQAHGVLAPVLGRFSEGFETYDVTRAQALLKSIGS